MPQEQLVRIMEIMCLAGAGLGICLLILAVMVFRCIANLDGRIEDLTSDLQEAQDAWDSEEAH